MKVMQQMGNAIFFSMVMIHCSAVIHHYILLYSLASFCIIRMKYNPLIPPQFLSEEFGFISNEIKHVQ